MDDSDVHAPIPTSSASPPGGAGATTRKAQEQGLARKSGTAADLYRQAASIIREARRQTRVLMEEGLIPEAPALLWGTPLHRLPREDEMVECLPVPEELFPETSPLDADERHEPGHFPREARLIGCRHHA